MKRSVTTISNDFNEEASLIFNAGSGLFILFSVFCLFALFFLLVLFVFGLEVNILPVAVAVMLSAAVAITVFILSYAIEMIIELRNNGE